MGNSLVMFTTPSESIGWVAAQRRKRAGEPRGGREPQSGPERIPVPSLEAAVWRPPAEPGREHGPGWHEDPRLRRAHLRAVRASLEAFLNGHLAHLDRMVRTGWFVLGRVRVRVVECRPAPEPEPGARARPRKPRRSRRRRSAP